MTYPPEPSHSYLTTPVAWICRLLLAAGFAALVHFAMLSAALPACGPGPAPNRWPMLAVVLGISAVALGAAGWLVGRAGRLDSTLLWVFALVGIMLVALFFLGITLLVLSFMTLC